MEKNEIIRILETKAGELRTGLIEIGHLLRMIDPTFTEFRGTWYKKCAEFGREGVFVEILYDTTVNSLWAGFGADDRRTLDRLLEDCRDEFAPRIFRSFAELQSTQLEDGCPIVESYGPYNGFGIYEQPGVYTLDVPRAVEFIERVLRCLPEYHVTDDAEARKTSISVMANHAEQAARNSNGQIVVRTVKGKEKKSPMTPQELETYVEQLLDKQNNRCALTGLELQFHGKHKDKNLLPSLDRIDSEHGYKKGNLQVVCRFINFWKSDTPNDEFKRLLDLVRQPR